MLALKIISPETSSNSDFAELVLSTGEIVWLDPEDLARVQMHTWRYEKYKDYRPNVFTDIPTPSGYKKMTLGKFLLNPPDGKRVQRNPQAHPLDFRKANLFLGYGEQKRLAGKPKGDFTSRFKGVHLSQAGWRATIQVNRKCLHLGLFSTEIQAAIAYDEAAIKYFGDRCFLNFK